MDKVGKLKKLQERYLSQLPGKLEDIYNAWQALLHDPKSESKQQLSQLAHNLAGSAGTFGFSAVGIEARNIEVILQKIANFDGLSHDAEMIINDSLQRISKLIESGPDDVQPLTSHAQGNLEKGQKVSKLVYILEDDEIMAKEIAFHLACFDYHVEIFTTLGSIIESIKSKLPSVMIVDLNLKEGDLAGAQFVKSLNDFSLVQVPTIFISVRDDWEARLAAVRAKCSAYLTKPLDQNELLERLDLITIKDAPDPFKVLIVDDMQVLAEHYAVVLNNAGMKVRVVTDIDDLLETLSDFQPELILMDIFMPQCSGLEAAKIVRQKCELLSVPIVFLSTESDPEKHLEAIQLGGDDFLQKPISDDRLLVAVRSRAERFRHLRSRMNRDGLTGLLNHTTMKSELDVEVARSHRQQDTLCFAMLDLDNFKNINDTYGHPFGDRVLKTVSRMLINRLRKSDIIGRYGGEEFAIVMPNTPIETAKAVVDDIRLNFSQIVHQYNEDKFCCTLSAGVSELTPNNSRDTLIRLADEALYKAKHQGKNTVCIN